MQQIPKELLELIHGGEGITDSLIEGLGGEKIDVTVTGPLGQPVSACNEAGIDALFPIIREVTSLEEAMRPGTARENLRLSVEQVFRLLLNPNLPHLTQ